jgi:signal peptidase I
MTLRDILVGRSLGRSLLRGLTLAAVLFAGSRYVLTPVRAHGISMLPTYGEGQLLLCYRLAYSFSPPRRGDVVAITLKGGQAVLVKRIIGLPGERIRIEHGQVFVNDEPLDEPYVRYRVPWEIRDTELGNGEIFVIGDNRSMPERLHDFGRAAVDRVMGRMIY